MSVIRRIVAGLLCIVGIYCSVRAFQVGRELGSERSHSKNPNSARILALEDSELHWRQGAGAGIVLGAAFLVLGKKKAPSPVPTP